MLKYDFSEETLIFFFNLKHARLIEEKLYLTFMMGPIIIYSDTILVFFVIKIFNYRL